MDLLTGKVKWYNSRQGYGFILNEQNEDVFVHFSTLNTMKFKTLVEGQTVTYVMGQDEGGRPMACNVTVITKLDELLAPALNKKGAVVASKVGDVAATIADINPMDEDYKISAQKWLAKTIPYVMTDAFDPGLHNLISVYKVGQALISCEDDKARNEWLDSIADSEFKDFVQKFIKKYPGYETVIAHLNENLYKIYKGRL